MPSSSHEYKAKLIFEKWTAWLVDQDKSVGRLSENFSELFYQLDRSKIPFDEAHSVLEQAVVAHYPPKDVAKFTFKNKKGLGKTEEEFMKDWHQLIRNKATAAFYVFYPLEEEEEAPMPGGMSREEYAKLRRYADSWPELDLSSIPLPEDLEGTDG